MEIRVLRYFLAVAHEENMTKAAEVLHLTQPTLSRQIADLERELGVTLLSRSSKGVSLTREGRLLRRRAEEIVALAEETAFELSSAYDDISGDIFIGMGETLGVKTIAGAVRELRERHPKVKVHLRSGNADYVIDHLKFGIFDLGVLIGHGVPDKCDMLFLPHEDYWGLLVPEGDPLAQRNSIASSELVGLPLLVSAQRNHGGQTGMTGYLPNASELNIIGTFNLAFNAMVMVESGCGYALSLMSLHERSMQGVTCVPISDAVPMRTLAVWKHDSMQSRVLAVFLDILRKRCLALGSR